MGHTRRGFLVGAATVATLGLTGCPAPSRSAPAPTTASTAPPSGPDPLAGVLTLHVELRAAYDGALAAVPALAGVTLAGTTPTVLRAEVDQHVSALAAAMAVVAPQPVSAPGQGTPGPGTPGPATPGQATSSTPLVPGDPAALLANLRASETALVKVLDALVLTVPAARAPLIGSIAASCACHVLALA